ncbi:helix-turn-helix domain-containing protein [Sphingomonas sp. BIUV-7]|uniref:Helix-turn-helix domain-containing protein n=1 Tax=Sphingomonas natans TaxID=3063330 RepID=A0ABT8Y6Y5_9SPHN|nr:helix-turn-helix domain-containing protein [Sphingomonas sp. BIUV-7]MDO6414064.1 helix-turn-helix domain-containing protein [Sphingomonas sp. BIUV-7]
MVGFVAAVKIVSPRGQACETRYLAHVQQIERRDLPLDAHRCMLRLRAGKRDIFISMKRLASSLDEPTDDLDALSDDVVADESAADGKRRVREPQNHRTVDRVTQIVEEVVYHPGMMFAELARALNAPKSSVYGFIQGLLAKGWLYEQNRRFYLGPAVHGLTLASGHMRAGVVNHEDMMRLHEETGAAVFLAVRAGNDIISIAEAGSDAIGDFEARSNIRRSMIATAGGKALLTSRPHAEIQAFLRNRPAAEQEMVAAYLAEYQDIRKTGLAINIRLSGTRFAIATCLKDKSGDAVAAVTLVGSADVLQPREKELGERLLEHVSAWSRKSVRPREAV